MQARDSQDSPGTLLAALIADPQVSGVGRLSMRTPLVPREPDGPASEDPADSPWWRSLDGEWQFCLLGGPDELTEDIIAASAPVDGTGWGTLQVPGAWTMQFDSEGARHLQPHYTNVVMPFDREPPAVPAENPVGVHRRTVTVPRAWRGRRVVLRVGAAESLLAVWVDGSFVGAGTDSRLPNEFELTDLVRPGRSMTVVLVVARWSSHTWLEDQDQWWHGGIQRSVTLYSTAESHIADVAAHPGLEGPDVGTLDLEVRLDGPVRREPGWTLTAVVRTLNGSGRSTRIVATTGPMPVPAWDASSEAAEVIGSMFVEPAVVRTALRAPNIRPWSHEDPLRYRVEVELVDPSGAQVESVSLLTGFRSVEVVDNELLINGQPVLLHGVNLHEHDPARGRAVDVDLTRADLELMKAHNLNAVRAAHYPHDEHLAALCDELGLYLVDEANVESHARQASLCHDPRFSAAILERVQRMVLRDEHHPSIIMWSLGNESGDGAAHAAAAAWVRHRDPTRPLHYEGPLMHDLYAAAPVTDVVCPMYASIEDIVAWARSGRDRRRPLILCEYSHAMGNSNGSLADYWAAIESNHGLQGGFIWEWVEHGIVDASVGTGPGGRISWRYGGDFGDVPNDANFVCDGLVSASREPHPAMREVHWIGRPVRTGWADDDGRRLRVSNQRWFGGIEDLRCRWELSVDGAIVQRGELEVPDLGPRDSALVSRPFRASAVPAGAECVATFRWSTRRATAWAPAGHEVGHDQLEVRARTRTVAPARPVGEPNDAASDRVEELPWAPSLFRALTDNDGLRQSWMRGLLGHTGRWIDQQGLDRTEWLPGTPRRRRLDGSTVWTSSGELRTPGVEPPVSVRRRVEQRADGWTRVEIRMRLPLELADPPRVGTDWVLPGRFTHVEWFGDGPHECYPDRCASTVVDRFTTAIEDTYVDYAVPQEHGHRTGMRWLALRDAATERRARAGLLVVADPSTGSGTLGWSARRHSDAELWACRHSDELAELVAARDPATFLALDAAQRGLGTASCGPDALGPYRIAAGTHVVAAWFRRFDPARVDPGDLAAEVRHRTPSSDAPSSDASR